MLLGHVQLKTESCDSNSIGDSSRDNETRDSLRSLSTFWRETEQIKNVEKFFGSRRRALTSWLWQFGVWVLLSRKTSSRKCSSRRWIVVSGGWSSCFLHVIACDTDRSTQKSSRKWPRTHGNYQLNCTDIDRDDAHDQVSISKTRILYWHWHWQWGSDCHWTGG